MGLSFGRVLEHLLQALLHPVERNLPDKLVVSGCTLPKLFTGVDRQTSTAFQRQVRQKPSVGRACVQQQPEALGMLRQNSTSALPSGEDGLRITMAGGSGGRTVVYDMICDKSASPTAGPSGLVGTHLAGFPNPALTYLITWRTPHACASAAPELLGTGKCGQTSVARLTSRMQPSPLRRTSSRSSSYQSDS